MKNIIVNGEERQFSEKATLSSILDDLGIKPKVMAAALNGEVVKKDQWESCTPKQNDKVEFLHFVGGG